MNVIVFIITLTHVERVRVSHFCLNISLIKVGVDMTLIPCYFIISSYVQRVDTVYSSVIVVHSRHCRHAIAQTQNVEQGR